MNDTPSIASTAASREKRRPGGQQGNKNAVTHGLTAKRELRTKSDKRRERADTLAILRSRGLEEDPIAKGIVRNLVRLETEARWAERYVSRRGRVDKAGEPKAVYRLYLENISPGADQWRRFMDLLSKGKDTGPAPVIEVSFSGAGWNDDAPPALEPFVCSRCHRLRELCEREERLAEQDPSVLEDSTLENVPDVPDLHIAVESGELAEQEGFCEGCRDRLRQTGNSRRLCANCKVIVLRLMGRAPGDRKLDESVEEKIRFRGSGWPGDRKPRW